MMDTDQLRKAANCVIFLDGAPEPAAEVAAMLRGAADEIDLLRKQLREAAGSYRPLDMNWPT